MVSEKLNDKYMGRNYIWARPNDESVKEGQPVRCLGVIEVESLGGYCLNLSSGMPVPLNEIGMYLKPTDVDASFPDKPIEGRGEFHRNEDLVKYYAVPDKKEETPQVVSSGISTQTVVEQPPVATVAQPQVKQIPQVVDIFNGFKKKPTPFDMTIDIDIPDYQLVKMMYSNSDNKDEFVTNFANYIINNINVDNVKTAILNTLSDESDDDVIES